MLIAFSWIVLACIAVAVVACSVINPESITENLFLKDFANQEVVGSMIVMVTVSFPVGVLLREKISRFRKKVQNSSLDDNAKCSIFDDLDSAGGKISRSNLLMVFYLMFSILFLVINGAASGLPNWLSALLIGTVYFFIVHSIMLMIEMYFAVDSWDDLDD